MNNEPRMRLSGGTIDPIAFYNKCHDENGRFCDDEVGGDDFPKPTVKLRPVDKKGLEIARKYHKRGVDKSGKDYTTGHLAQTGSSLPPDLAMAGWLHDTIEDTDATPESLKRDGVDDETIRIIKAVSIDSPQYHPDLWRDYEKTGVKPPYSERIQSVIDNGGPRAARVKIADTSSNGDLSRPRPEGASPDKYIAATKQLADYLKKADPVLYKDYVDRSKSRSFDWSEVEEGPEEEKAKWID